MQFFFGKVLVNRKRVIKKHVINKRIGNNKKGLSVKYLCLCATALLVSLGCSTTNTVNRVLSESSQVRYSEHEGYEDRFRNLYDDVKNYPVTCTGNCYPPHEDIKCQSNMQDCKYVGKRPKVQLNTGFDITWLGHATFVIKTPDNKQILVDPVFGQFDWPVNWAFRLAEGFNRNLPATLSQRDIMQTDAVLYSHIHYDHFNKSDIETIGNNTEYLVPLGFAEHFPNNGYSINEMPWYASYALADTQIHFVPAHHFSNRIWVPYLYEDNNASLWGGWLIEHNGKRIYFAGDTGYSAHFKAINERYGNIDICLLPIASYHSEESPRWYRKVHTTPEDAIVASNELGCKVVIPWGFGNATWRMGDKTSHSALFRLLHMKQQLNTSMPWVVLNEGDSASF